MTGPAEMNFDLMAGEYVLGTLAGEARTRFAACLAQDASLRALVTAWEQRLGPLSASVVPVEPPEGCLAAVERRLASTFATEAEASAVGSTIRADAGDWVEIAPGVAMKLLRRDPADGRQSALLRLQPGATIAAHGHLEDEECLVIEGEIEIGTLRLAAGDYHCALRGSPHGTLVSRGGALLFVRSAPGE